MQAVGHLISWFKLADPNSSFYLGTRKYKTQARCTSPKGVILTLLKSDGGLSSSPAGAELNPLSLQLFQVYFMLILTIKIPLGTLLVYKITSRSDWSVHVSVVSHNNELTISSNWHISFKTYYCNHGCLKCTKPGLAEVLFTDAWTEKSGRLLFFLAFWLGLLFHRQVGKKKKKIKYTEGNNVMGSLVWVSACIFTPASEAVSAAVIPSWEVTWAPYGPLLVWRNVGSPAEQGSWFHHERKGIKPLNSISSSQRVGEGERGGGENSSCSSLNLF